MGWIDGCLVGFSRAWTPCCELKWLHLACFAMVNEGHAQRVTSDPLVNGQKKPPRGVVFFVDGDQQFVQAAEAKAALKVALGHMMALSFSGEG